MPIGPSLEQDNNLAPTYKQDNNLGLLSSSTNVGLNNTYTSK